MKGENCFFKTEELLCNRKDLQQLVAGSTAAVCAQRDARSKAFQLECAVKRIFFLRHKNKAASKRVKTKLV